MRCLFALLASALLAGCGGSSTKPEAMSAQGHEQAARRDERSADTERRVGGVQVGDRAIPSIAAADGYEAHARAHHEAALALTEAEQTACAGVDDEHRATCPFRALRFSEARATARGYEARYSVEDASALEAHLRCHHAFGARMGREGMPGCPLYQKGLSIAVTPVDGGALVRLESDSPEVRAELGHIYGITPEAR